VVGDLTIKGITNQVSFPAEVKVEGDVLTASGTASIDRTKWDIKYGSGKFFSDLGDNMIKDEFEIKFELKATASEE
jgi:polyisoprenoid-binding protein YceI